MQSASSLLTIVIGLVNTPARANWPKHGEIALRDNATGTAIGNIPFFSYEAGREFIETLARMELIDQATLTTTCLALGRLALPTARHRFDRLYRAFDPESGEQFVELFTGSLKPSSSNRNTNFVICKDGRFCQSRMCRRYSAHGALVLGGRDRASSEVVFSSTCHTVMLRNAFTSGLLTDTELERLTKNTSLEENEVTQQADLLVASAENTEDRVRSLNLLFSEQVDPRANDFTHCGSPSGKPHVHFAGELARLKNSGGLESVREVNEAIDDLLTSGGTSQRGAEAMRAKIPELGLPAGEQKQRRTAGDDIEDLLNEFTDLLGGDPRSMGDFGRFRVSPEMLERIFRRQGKGSGRPSAFGNFGGAFTE